MKRVRPALAHSPHFRSLAAADLAALAALGRVKTLRPGESCAGPCLVLEGRLRVRSITAHGEEFIYTDLGRGEFFGLAPVLGHRPPPLESHAVGVLTLALFSAAALRSLLDARPLLWRAFACLFHDHLVNSMLLARDIGVAPLPQRLAKRLLWEALAEGSAAHSPVKLNLSQSDLARMLGTGRSVVNGALKRLERTGALAIGYRSVKLLDMAALRQMAGPDLVLR